MDNNQLIAEKLKQLNEAMKNSRTEKISKRQEANKKILDTLYMWVEMFPDMRFGQLLYAMDVIKMDEDAFNIESVDIYNRMRK